MAHVEESATVGMEGSGMRFQSPGRSFGSWKLEAPHRHQAPVRDRPPTRGWSGKPARAAASDQAGSANRARRAPPPRSRPGRRHRPGCSPRHGSQTGKEGRDDSRHGATWREREQRSRPGAQPASRAGRGPEWAVVRPVRGRLRGGRNGVLASPTPPSPARGILDRPERRPLITKCRFEMQDYKGRLQARPDPHGSIQRRDHAATEGRAQRGLPGAERPLASARMAASSSRTRTRWLLRKPAGRPYPRRHGLALPCGHLPRRRLHHQPLPGRLGWARPVHQRERDG